MIKSDYAILDVKGGRMMLRKRLKREERVPVTIVGLITTPGNDDGVSQEFYIDVERVEIKE